VPNDTELLRQALEARERQVAELRAALADVTSELDLVTADVRSHEREANAQRERADTVEREAIAQRERADALAAREPRGLFRRGRT
jgi:chromosome segregation ATPase